MKKVLLGICSGLLALQLSSCSEDFKIAAPYKDVTIVYGLLSYGDTAQYIRIQKAYMDENRSALELAKIADSNFYRNLEVHLKTLDGPTVTADVKLEKVDLNAEGYPKEPGTFFTAPNYAYKLRSRDRDTLDQTKKYRLVILNKETGDKDSAETEIITNLPGTGFFPVTEFLRPTYAIDFSNNNAQTKFTLTIPTPTPTAKYFEGYLRFKYVTKEDNVQKDTFFIWRFATTVPVGGSAKLEVPTNQFFPMVKALIPPAKPNQIRYVDSADLYVWAADQNYYNYMVANQIVGGITADQVKPIFTTIQGTDALGLFGSRARRIRYNIPLNDATIDSLKRSIYTRDIGFDGRSDH